MGKRTKARLQSRLVGFKKRNQMWQLRCRGSDAEAEADTSVYEVKIIKRHSTSITQLLPRTVTTVTRKMLLRPTASLEACGDNSILPGEFHTQGEISGGLTGNRLIDMVKLAEAIGEIMRHHNQRSPLCEGGNIRIPAAKEILRGLGSTVTVRCVDCHQDFGPFKLFREVSGPNRSGPKVVAAHYQLAHVLGKTSLSKSDVRLVFSGIDCPPPSNTHLQRLVNKQAVTWIATNEQQI